MKLKLRVPSNAVEAVVPSPISSKEITGEARPVGTFGAKAGNEVYVTSIAPAPATNVGRYVPPPKNPIWTNIPLGIKPTKPCSSC